MQSAQRRQRKREQKRLEREEARRADGALAHPAARRLTSDQLRAMVLLIRLLQKEVETLEAETDAVLRRLAIRRDSRNSVLG
jgi:hypothetical protein